LLSRERLSESSSSTSWQLGLLFGAPTVVVVANVASTSPASWATPPACSASISPQALMTPSSLAFEAPQLGEAFWYERNSLQRWLSLRGTIYLLGTPWALWGFDIPRYVDLESTTGPPSVPNFLQLFDLRLRLPRYLRHCTLLVVIHRFCSRVLTSSMLVPLNLQISS
jgi:hypothetical protein